MLGLVANVTGPQKGDSGKHTRDADGKHDCVEGGLPFGCFAANPTSEERPERRRDAAEGNKWAAMNGDWGLQQ